MIIRYEDIAQRAYQLWLEEGRPEGRDRDHWLRAEETLRKQGLKKQRGRKITSEDPAILKTPRGENL